MALLTHYYTYVGHETNTKNKLQEEFKVYLKSLEGILIDAITLPLFKNEILKKAQELNDKHNRCNPIVISFGKLYSNKGLRIDGYHFVTFQILEAYYCYNFQKH